LATFDVAAFEAFIIKTNFKSYFFLNIENIRFGGTPDNELPDDTSF
jgi:hypothetical protein